MKTHLALLCPWHQHAAASHADFHSNVNNFPSLVQVHRDDLTCIDESAKAQIPTSFLVQTEKEKDLHNFRALT